ncbi:hypothetical protein IAT38_007301 [Cryptococcus sp. DSM 104549]
MPTLKVGRSAWSHATALLWFACITYSMGDIMFGIDTGSFGSLQALPSFLNEFGTLGANGKYGISTQRKSIMNSVVWIGKGLGTIAFEPVLEKLGYKWTMYIVCAIQTIGIIIELTAKNWVVFSVGRVFAYLAVGLVENAVPSYTSEVTPAPLRGFFSGSLIMIVTLGNLWGAGMGRAYANETKRVGWLVPVAVQLIPVVILVVLLPFTPESPRWLVLRGRKEEALKQLNRLRTKSDVASGTTISEVDAIEQSIVEAEQTGSGSWLDLFRGNYFRRAMICTWLFIFQQITGSQFVNSYGPTFYTLMGLGSKAFTYQVVTQAMSVIGCLIAMTIFDKVGRRPVLIVGCALQILFMCLVAGLGSKSNHTTSDANGVIASVILFTVSVKVSLSTNAYLIGSEIGGVKMRKKILAFGTFWDVVAAFVVTYSVPYLLGTPGANLGPKVGWIFAGIAAAALVFVTFFVPEFAGRSLEETDELFEKKLWAWQFDKATTTGVGARIAEIEASANHGGVKPTAERSLHEDIGDNDSKDQVHVATGDRV